ncbi:hypothetical protein DFH11DRAFT_1685701 [Phellopilus nigrolimitatus]|nr:hypothetical protein DFH11DRAFT_1685701 [Phellopilus nigrolimitatus]
MSNQPTAGEQAQNKPLHLSFPSLATNASGVADSTISHASDWTGISQFPAPPAEIPDPELISLSTPRSASSFAERSAPSIPDYTSPTRFTFGTPPAPGSPADPDFPTVERAQDSRSASSMPTERRAIAPVVPSRVHTSKPDLPLEPPPSLQALSSARHPLPSTSRNAPPPSRISLRASQKRPASTTLRSCDAASGISGISVNPNEERLLSTSFITSLLSQSREPFPGRKLVNARGQFTRALEKERGDGASQSSGGNAVASTAASSRNHSTLNSIADVKFRHAHQSAASQVASFHPSDLYSVEGPATQAQLTPASDGQSISASTSAAYSEILDSEDDQVHSLMRSRNLSFARGGINVIPVGIMPAYRMSCEQESADGTNNSVMTSNNSITTSASLISRPPGHRADAPRNVGRIDADSVLHEFEEDFTGLGSVDFHMENGGLPLSPALPSSAETRKKLTGTGSRPSSGQARRSIQRSHSLKSVVSSAVSRISSNSAARKAKYMTWLMQRPLPPLPPLSNYPPARIHGSADIQREEEGLPLPTLMRRAENLQSILNVGKLPANSTGRSGRPCEEDGAQGFLYASDGNPYVPIGSKEEPRWPPAQPSPSEKASSPEQKKRKRRLWTIGVGVIVVVILIIAIPLPACTGNLTGMSCTLDASGSYINTLFAANFTASQLSDAVVDAQGQPSGKDCASQALLVDVEPGLNSALAPNPILWNLGLSEDKFVSKAPWSTLPSVDGPVDAPKFAVNASGFTFDFAAQTVTPMNVSFKQRANPSETQLSEVSDTAGRVLDRMYSYALASSTQRQKTLLNYWTTVLQQQESDFLRFVEAVQNSVFLIPFDVTSSPGGHSLTSLMSNDSSTLFPPPIACYPGLNSTQLARINALETSVFGLAPAPSASSFAASCFPERPVYGVVDLLRLRLPFPDDRKGVALQASALSKDATVRAVLYSGEVASALPGAAVLPGILASTTDPREFGTTSNLNNVLLNYLSSISNVTLAMDLISHVLSSSAPPANNSDLTNSLSTIPLLEFAVFGSIRPQDIASSVSSFSTQSGSLFFGSSAGQTFRSWALVNSSASIAWTESATSPEIVRESATVDKNFENVWTPASELVKQGNTNSNDVQKVIQAFSSLGLFSS